MSDPLIHPNPTAQDVLKKVIDWASRRCPADDESVPCPLCGARADVPGDACKAVESIFPRELLRELRSVLAVESTPPSPQLVGDVDRLAAAFQDGFTNGNAEWETTPEHHRDMLRAGVMSLTRNFVDSEQKLRSALQRIARWFGEFPETGQFWDEEKTRPMSYAACFGSNGERDFMRDIAQEALNAAPSPVPESNALLDVASERLRQVEKEGWTPEHDDAHHDFSMAKAACIYAVGATLNSSDRAVMDSHGADGTPGWMKELWPWDITWWKPTGRRRDLVKAAALIIAEIERLDRAKYLNLVDGKIYEIISREGDMVAFKREGRETPHYLCSEEFDRRFKLQTPAPSQGEASP